MVSALVVALTMASCSKEQTQKANSEIQNLETTQNGQPDCVYNATNELRALHSAIRENQDLIRGIRPTLKTRSQSSDNTQTVDTAAVVALAESLYIESYDLLQKLEITSEDIELVYGKGVNVEELSHIDAVGLALFLDMSFRTTAGMRTRSISRGDIIDCALQAAGVVEIGELIDGLAGKAISRAAIKAALKVGLKAGGRVLGGIGLAIMAAEFAYCLYQVE